MAERINIDELNSFVSAVVQADSLGIPIAQVLRVQAKEMRIKRSQRAEEAAQKVPVKIIFPLIFCILPSLFVIVIGPAAIRIVHAFVHL
jgi:tight adherence protein C